jgi:hypothetical protein
MMAADSGMEVGYIVAIAMTVGMFFVAVGAITIYIGKSTQ